MFSHGVEVVGRDHFAKADVAADPEGVAAAIEGERRAPDSEYFTLDYFELERLGAPPSSNSGLQDHYVFKRIPTTFRCHLEGATPKTK